MKIAKHIQQAGLASRRQAEAWVRAGRVQVGKEVMTNPAERITRVEDILLDGKPVAPPQLPKAWLYHKPAGLLVTRTDPQDRAVIFDHLPDFAKNLMAVGRLDMASEGLLLLTNNGALARTLELPQTALVRKYRVRVFGVPDKKALTELQKGVKIGGVFYQPTYVALEKMKQGRNHWVAVHLTEGKNREVRILMESLGLQVNRLIRTAYGPFKIGKLKQGEVVEVSEQEIKPWLSSA